MIIKLGKRLIIINRNGYGLKIERVFTHKSKRAFVVECLQRSGLDVVVETGTHMGDMIQAVLPYCKRIYSIELDDKLFSKAVEKFKAEEKVKLFHGDSGKELSKILETLNKPVLFWLDGHFSGEGTARGDFDTPIKQELATILGGSVSDNLILIDDARLFNGKNDYPDIKDLRSLIANSDKKYKLTVKNDIIVIKSDKERLI